MVWSDYGNGTNRGFWYRNLATGQQRRLDASPGTRPQLSGDLLCYEYQGRIHVHSIGTGRDLAVSPAGGSASACDISGRVVVWQDVRNGHDADIYAYDLDSRSETRLTTTSTDQTLPRIDHGIVVWQDAISATNSDIYADDLATGTVTQVTADESVQWFADVADGRIVWMDERDGHDNTEIYLYDVASGVTTRVTRHDGWSGNPTIAGDRIAFEDSRGAGHKIYLRTVTPPTLSLGRVPGSPASPQGLRTPARRGRCAGDRGVRRAGDLPRRQDLEPPVRRPSPTCPVVSPLPSMPAPVTSGCGCASAAPRSTRQRSPRRSR